MTELLFCMLISGHRRLLARCTLSIGTGKEEWGAEANKQYYKLRIHEITKKKNC